MGVSAGVPSVPLLFGIGLAVRVCLLLLVLPNIQSEWFLTFLRHFVAQPSIDPWTTFMEAGGDFMAYPYGPVMLLVHAPLVAIGVGVDALLGGTYASGLAFRLTLLLVDLGTYQLLRRLFPTRPHGVVLLFWISPIALYVTYVHGQTDIVPVFFLVASLEQLKRHRFTQASALLAVAAAAKLSMIIAFPFVLVYMWRNRRLAPHFLRFATVFSCLAAVLLLPYLASPGFLRMVVATPEAAKLYEVAIAFSAGYSLYVTPLSYLLLLYFLWRIRRISFSLLLAVTGIAFSVVVLLTPASVGWHLWLLPFFPSQTSEERWPGYLLMATFFLLVTGMHLFVSQGAALAVSPDVQLLPWSYLDPPVTPHLRSLWMTLVTATGIIVVLRILRDGVANNDHYRLSRKPLAVCIGGDSSAGKDTLSTALTGLFGTHSVVPLSGDDYHAWDRKGRLWKAMTHLNPRANDLLRFARDVQALLGGRSIMSYHYDHETGRFDSGKRVPANDVLIVSGLHALYVREIYTRADVAVFLDPDEDLRRAWKVLRDTERRDSSPKKAWLSIESRMMEAKRFIHPQRKHADIVLKVLPVQPFAYGDPEKVPTPPSGLRLQVEFKEDLHMERLAKVLIGICGLHLDRQLVEDSRCIMVIEGDVDAQDISLAANKLLERVDELLDLEPQWRGGILGLMQLVVLSQASEALRRRSAA